MRYTGLLLLWFCVNHGSLYSQSLKVGDTIPGPAFHVLSGTKNTSLYILDFWSTWCTSCVDAFPKIDALQKQFPDKLKIVLVNSWERKEDAVKRLEKINYNIGQLGNPRINVPQTAALYNDSIFIQLFPTKAVPKHIWIDSIGVVIAITSGYNATTENVRKVFDHKKLEMEMIDDIGEGVNRKYIKENGLIGPTTPLAEKMYYSAFVPFLEVGGGKSQYVNRDKHIFRTTIYNADPVSLFKIAFNNPDSVPLRVIRRAKQINLYEKPEDPNDWDKWEREYCFTYELQTDLANRTNWRNIMQVDVNQFLGNRYGIIGEIEDINLQCLILVKKKEGVTASRKLKEVYRVDNTLFLIHNSSYAHLSDFLFDRLEDMNSLRPFIDETGIDRGLLTDIQLTGNLSYVEVLRSQLNKYGLDIIEGERKVPVLVIRDKIQ